MTVWSDDFSHDYFASRYVLLDGVEGANFTVGPDLAANHVSWRDDHNSMLASTHALVIQDPSRLFYLQLGLRTADGNSHIGASLYGVAMPPDRHAFQDRCVLEYFVHGAGSASSTAYLSELAGVPMTVTFAIDEAHSSFSLGIHPLDYSGGDPVGSLTLGIAPADLTALQALTLHPYASVVGLSSIVGGGPDAVATLWSYDHALPPPPATLVVGANPKSIPADGTSTSDVTAYVRDHTGAGVAGLAVAFTPTDHFLGAVTDNGDGTYDTAYTSSADPGSVEVQAKTGGVSATTAIQQRPQGDLHAGPSQVGIVRRN